MAGLWRSLTLQALGNNAIISRCGTTGAVVRGRAVQWKFGADDGDIAPSAHCPV
jgi:hypothetical protein